MNIVRKKRRARGYTQETLARETGLAQSMISNIENGKRRPSVENEKILGAVLGFDWIELFEDDEISVETMKRKEGA